MSGNHTDPTKTSSDPTNHTEIFLFIVLGTVITSLVMWVLCQNRKNLDYTHQEENQTTLPPRTSCNPVQPDKCVVQL